jgi:hypothetical protein
MFGLTGACLLLLTLVAKLKILFPTKFSCRAEWSSMFIEWGIALVCLLIKKETTDGRYKKRWVFHGTCARDKKRPVTNGWPFNVSLLWITT